MAEKVWILKLEDEVWMGLELEVDYIGMELEVELEAELGMAGVPRRIFRIGALRTWTGLLALHHQPINQPSNSAGNERKMSSR